MTQAARPEFARTISANGQAGTVDLAAADDAFPVCSGLGDFPGGRLPPPACRRSCWLGRGWPPMQSSQPLTARSGRPSAHWLVTPEPIGGS